MNAYIKNTERFQINDLMLHLKLLERQEQAKLKTSRREIKNKSQNQQNRDQKKKKCKKSMKQNPGSLKR
jgi:hypothetical protein